MGARSLGCTALLIACLARGAIAADSGLLSRIPPGANAIAFIDVDKLLKSPLGVKEKWKEKLKNAFAATPMLVPPNAARLMLASSIDPNTVAPIWEVSVIELTTTPSMEKIAKAENGYVDTIAEKQAVWSPANAYFVRLDSKVLGTVAPANRQFAARWARQGGAPGDSVSPYLKAAADSMDDKTSYLFAMDLEDVTSPRKVRRRLESGSFESLAGKNIDPEKLGQLFASLKGVTLRVSVDDAATGMGIIEFGRSPAMLADVAKPLLLEILEGCGAAIDDFNDWNVAVEGNAIVLGGKLTKDGMRKLFSIVEPPSPNAAGVSGDGETAAARSEEKADANAVVAASKQYYTTVSDIIDNVGKKVRNSSSMTQGATWIARDARRIDRLPILNVDPDLVKWGIDVSGGLNDIASTVGVGGLNARSATVGIQDAYSQGGGTASGYQMGREGINPNDSVDRRNVERQRRATLAAEKAKTGQAAVQILRQLDTYRATIRAAMTQKYKVQF